MTTLLLQATLRNTNRLSYTSSILTCQDQPYCANKPCSSLRIGKKNLSSVVQVRKEANANSVVNNEPEELSMKADSLRNPANIQMISDYLYQQIFLNQTRQRQWPTKTIEKVKQHLSSHSLWQQKVPSTESINLKIPPLEGNSIDDHFRTIAKKQTVPYENLIKELTGPLPEMPHAWVFNEGWTKYSSNRSPISVPFPEEDAYVFDVEVCLSSGNVPTMACAVSSKAWYSWCSPVLIKGIDRDPKLKITLDDLIPFESRPDEWNQNREWIPKLIVGHNVSYDRARIKEQYFLKETKLRFLDTMSLHIAVSGITSFQRALKMTMKNGLESISAAKREDLMIAGSLEWNDLSSLNNLRDVYKLYCNGKELDKDARNFFVTGTIPVIKENFQSLMSYCANDVLAAHEVFVNLMPSFFERFPHPVTLSGMLEMGMTYLPINSNWLEYINQSEKTYNQLDNETKLILMEKAEEALGFLSGEKYKHDPWLWDLDWKVTKPRKSKKVIGNIPQEAKPVYPAWYKKLFYKETDEDYKPGPSKISTSMRLVPKILRLCWYGFPLHYSKKGGWGYLTKSPSVENEVDSMESGNMDLDSELLEDAEENTSAVFPYEQWLKLWDKNCEILLGHVQNSKLSTTRTQMMASQIRVAGETVAEELNDFIKGLKAITSIGLRNGKRKRGNAAYPRSMKGASPHPKCDFVPLPHKDGDNLRVGNPLAKDFLNKIEEGTLSSADGLNITNKVVRLSKTVSYWRNNRDRIMEQMTIWMKDSELSKKGLEFGAILPQVAIAGTLTRRAVEKTWMTASNAYPDRLGSELKGIVQTPPGFRFVGADVDSQELWIASVIGDATFGGFHGSTALGWMTLQGNKSDGTDMHSRTASMIGIHRDQAKILNYGRIYGAGVIFAERLLRQFNPRLSTGDARTKARTMYNKTKGQRKYLLNEEGEGLIASIPEFSSWKGKPLSKDELNHLLRCLEYPPIDSMDLIKKVVWDEGAESPMFNRLEEIAQMDCPVTPILGCSISRSLVPSVVHQDFMTSRVNWVVQSSAVDYLHLMLTSMRWLIDKYHIDGRFAISVHDEVRYLVKSEDKYRAALALQITNLLTRSLCSHSVGIDDLPESVAFFSSVDIDKVLRKEVTDDCVTPSNPNGLKEGYGIPKGEALSIHDLLNIIQSLEESPAPVNS